MMHAYINIPQKDKRNILLCVGDPLTEESWTWYWAADSGKYLIDDNEVVIE